MHVWSVLTTSFPAHLFWTSVPCIIDPQPRNASVLVLCLLTGPSEFVVDFVKILTEVGKLQNWNSWSTFWRVICCVTNERPNVTCFVTHGDNALQRGWCWSKRHFTHSCKVQKLSFWYTMLFAHCLPSALSKVATRYLRKKVFVVLDHFCPRASNAVVCSRLERCSLWWWSFSAQVKAYVCLLLILCLMRRWSGFTFDDTIFWHILFLFLCGSPAWWRCRFQGRIIKAWSGSLDTALIVDEASAKEAVVANCFLLVSAVLTFRLCSWLKEGFHLCTLSFVSKHTRLGTVSVCLAWSSPLSQCCRCVDCLCWNL